MSTILTNHFWMFGLLVVYVNLAIGRYRMQQLITSGRLSTIDANRFCVRAAVALTAVCGALEVLSFTSGTTVPCQMSLPMTHPTVWTLYAPILLSGVALLVWVWRLGGDRTLALVGPAFTRGRTLEKTYTPRRVRVFVTALIVIAWGGHFAVRLAGPTPTTAFGCPEQAPLVH